MDPDDLLRVVERELSLGKLDYRTRLLIRDSLNALQDRWGIGILNSRISIGLRMHANEILAEPLEKVGFPTLGARMREHTDASTVLAFLRELGHATDRTTRLEIGGSTALILNGLLRRGTDYIDVVNEVPALFRTNHDLLNGLATRHGLMLTHFQSHYLPAGYEQRLHYLDRFGDLDVYLIDPLDIFIGKLFSRREKDLDDLRMLKGNFLWLRLRSVCKSHPLRWQATKNFSRTLSATGFSFSASHCLRRVNVEHDRFTAFEPQSR